MIIRDFFGRKSLVAALALGLLAGVSLVSCSSDDDGDGDGGGESTLDAPEYADVSGKYEVINDEIETIELTESGEYYITKNFYYQYAKTRAAKKRNMLKSRMIPSTRAAYNNVIYGKYTKVSDTEFLLEGFGKIIIVGSPDEAQSLKIIEDGKGERTVGVEMRENDKSCEQTAWLCRTWNIEKCRIKLKILGKTEFDKTVDADDLGQLESELAEKIEDLFDNYDEEEDYYGDAEYYEDDYYEEGYCETPHTVVFTKAGSYMVTYKEGGLAISTWCWEDAEKGTIRYSWDYDHLYDPEESGIVTAYFDKEELTITEKQQEFDEDTGKEIVSIEMIWYMSEMK
jgi:hypothetical protein